MSKFNLDKIVSSISRFQKIELKKRKEKSMKKPKRSSFDEKYTDKNGVSYLSLSPLELIPIKKEKAVNTPITKTITDKAPTLAEMQKFVGGYIEVVYAPNGDQIVLDEEGRLKGKEVNKEASEYWLGDRVDDEFANIVGDALILKGKARLE